MLQRWFLDSATARELGLVTNGHASRGGGNPSPGSTNLTLLPGTQSPEEMIAAIGEGLYVTEMIGHGANLVTGDYSRGAAGFAIRGGKLAEAVSEITIAGNLRDMFLNLVAGQRPRLPLLGQRADDRRRRHDDRGPVSAPWRRPARPTSPCCNGRARRRRDSP